MTVTDVFLAALVGQDQPAHEAGSLPDRVARACVAALAVDAAGITYTPIADRCLPVGASDPRAELAERVEFALGDGPGVQARRDRRTVAASMTLLRLQLQWPVYAVELVEQTSFRSVAAFPVTGAFSTVVTVELYCTPPREATTLHPRDTGVIAVLAGDAVAADLVGNADGGGEGPDWLCSPRVLRRERVWSAVDAVSAQSGSTPADSLARLRAHAFCYDTDLETAADRVLAGELPGR